MFSSFMGGGNSSQTATVGGSGNSSSAPKEESKSSAFKSFGGKGVSLGSDIGSNMNSMSTSVASTR